MILKKQIRQIRVIRGLLLTTLNLFFNTNLTNPFVQDEDKKGESREKGENIRGLPQIYYKRANTSG